MFTFSLAALRKPMAVAGMLLASLFLSQAETPIRHSFLATGAETYILSESGERSWSHPLGTRDAWVLPNGNVVAAITKGKTYSGGGAVEIRPKDNKIVFEYRGQQDEVNTVQKLSGGRYLVTEAGSKPRILEVDRKGKVRVEVPIQCQLTNFHMQSRMARKLANGNYLVPQLFDKVVREYSPQGKIVWEVATPNWPFTAIRLANGNTLIGCTYGNVVIEVDRAGKTVWQLSNQDLPEPLIKDACGIQRLANGNTVITSYGAGKQPTKLFEVTPQKQLVWSHKDNANHGIHHFQILTTNGRREPWPALK